MKIGIIGAGNVGTAIGARLAAKGHGILLSFARSQSKLDEAARSIGGGAKVGTPAEAARFGEVVLVATPWTATLEALRPLAAELAGKVVWDTTNALKPDLSGLLVGTTSSAGEEIQATLPGARVVKAIPPFAELMHSGDMLLNGEKAGVFVCGDDAAGRDMVSALVSDLDAAPCDAGPLINARYAEPAAFLLVQLAYAQGYGTRIGLSLLRG